MTSYDTIWTTFMDNCKTPDINLPDTDEKIYANIKNGVMLFNNRMGVQVVCNDASESVDVDLNSDQLLLLANFIKLVFYKNELMYFETLFNPFQKEVGLKNFSAQLTSMRYAIQNQEDYIERLFRNQAVDYL